MVFFRFDGQIHKAADRARCIVSRVGMLVLDCHRTSKDLARAMGRKSKT